MCAWFFRKHPCSQNIKYYTRHAGRSLGVSNKQEGETIPVEEIHTCVEPYLKFVPLRYNHHVGLLKGIAKACALRSADATHSAIAQNHSQSIKPEVTEIEIL